MKNTLNLVLAVLFFVVLGCACPRISRLTGGPPPPPPAAPAAPDSPPSPANSGLSSGTSGGLTMAKYEQIKIDMPKRDVERILGRSGEEVSSSSGGGMTFSVFKWTGENYTSIILTFKDDRVMSKSQVGLK